jgi:subtilisin-like proprotein convertase family protein
MNFHFPIRLLAFIVVLILCKDTKATVFSNTTSITINDNAISSVYPSNINVAGMVGVITNVEVTINNLSHTWVHDVSIILQAPTGQSLLLQSGTADNMAANNLTYTISDLASTQFSSSAIWANNGSYKPTSYFWDIWPAPAPPTPPGIGTYNTPGPFGFMTETFNSTFGGLNPNGTWKLFVADFASGDAGMISGGWSINIVTSLITPVTLHYFNAVKKNNIAQLNWKVANEKNIAKYSIEHSTNNIDFEIVGEVKCSVNSTGENEYTFANSLIKNSVNYYRLKMIDNDHKFSFSNTEIISNLKNDLAIRVYPSVTNNIVTIEATEPIQKVTVYSIAGIKIADYLPSVNSFQLETRDYLPGIYFLSIENETNKILEKIVVVK